MTDGEYASAHVMNLKQEVALVSISLPYQNISNTWKNFKQIRGRVMCFLIKMFPLRMIPSPSVFNLNTVVTEGFVYETCMRM
jgi:hypothetical protein